MDRETAKQQIRAEWQTVLPRMLSKAKKKANRTDSYVCPFCGHGQGGDGLTYNPKSDDGNGLKCFGCDWRGDDIALYQEIHGVGFVEALEALAGWLGIDLDPIQGTTSGSAPSKPTQKKAAAPELLTKWRDDQTIVCIMDTQNYDHKPKDVWQIRGREQSPTPMPEPMTPQDFARSIVSGKTFYPAVYNKVQTGVDEKSGKPKYDYRRICQQVFVVDIDNEETYTGEDGKKHKKALDVPLTIPKALDICEKNDIKPFFVYETFSSKEHRGDEKAPYMKFRLVFLLDKPLQVQKYGDVGVERAVSFFIGLFGPAADQVTTDAGRLIYGTDEPDRAKAYKYVIDGEKLMKRLLTAPEPAEDPADVDQADPEAMTPEEYAQTSAASDLESFFADIQASADKTAYSTGFADLDNILDGGLYPGLYILGAVSSLGKTSFALQIMDQIAQQGHDVLIFSLEMDRRELMAKSISRQTYMLAARKNHAKTTRGILTGAKYADYSNVEKDLIQKAAKVYAYYAGHIRIFESIGKFSVEEIAEKVQTHIHLTGRRPVVLVDYLQILQPPDQGASDKANMDTIMLQLKQLSRDIEIPVFAISSFNRENYETPVNAGAFKESGSIEYGCDVLFALQYEGMDYQDGEAKEARLKRIRQLTKSNEQKAADGNAVRIQLKTLKNRNGKKGQVLFDFWPMFNTFREASLAGMPEYGTAESVLQRASNEVDVFADIRKPK